MECIQTKLVSEINLSDKVTNDLLQREVFNSYVREDLESKKDMRCVRENT